MIDAFDKIDCITPIERQEYMLDKVSVINGYDFNFSKFEEVANYFRGLINLLKQMNYSEFKSETFKNYEKELESLIEERRIA